MAGTGVGVGTGVGAGVGTGVGVGVGAGVGVGVGAGVGVVTVMTGVGVDVGRADTTGGGVVAPGTAILREPQAVSVISASVRQRMRRILFFMAVTSCSCFLNTSYAEILILTT